MRASSEAQPSERSHSRMLEFPLSVWPGDRLALQTPFRTPGGNNDKGKTNEG